MLYSVRIDLTRGLALPPEQLESLRSRERDMVAQLAERGVLIRLWRLPDAPWGNLGLWRAGDRDELERALEELPLRPWMDLTIEALTPHPSDPGLDDRSHGGPRHVLGGDS